MFAALFYLIGRLCEGRALLNGAVTAATST